MSTEQIGVFPESIYATILSKIDDPEVLAKMLLVCKKWNSILNQDLLWKKFGFINKAAYIERSKHDRSNAQLAKSMMKTKNTNSKSIKILLIGASNSHLCDLTDVDKIKEMMSKYNFKVEFAGYYAYNQFLLEIWFTEGQERFKPIISSYIKNTQVLVVFSSPSESFKNLFDRFNFNKYAFEKLIYLVSDETIKSEDEGIRNAFESTLVSSRELTGKGLLLLKKIVESIEHFGQSKESVPDHTTKNAL